MKLQFYLFFTPANKNLLEVCCVLAGDVAKLQPKFKNFTQEPSNSNSYWEKMDAKLH
jgi:hypothetical protein